MTPDEQWTLLGSVSRGFRAPHMTDLGTLGLTGSGFEVAAPDVAGLDGEVGTTADATAVSTGDPVEQVGPETSLQYEASIRLSRGGWRTELSLFVNNVHDNIQKQALILPPGAVGTVARRADRSPRRPTAGPCSSPRRTVPVLVRANFDNARIWGIEHSCRSARSRPRCRCAARSPTCAPGTPDRPAAEHRRRHPGAAGVGIGALDVAPDRRWWVEPYPHVAWKQTHLSTLDLGDRRTGAGRSRVDHPGVLPQRRARARLDLGRAPTASFDTADDLLIATGETLLQIQDRVLGVGVNSSSLFTAVPGYATFGVRPACDSAHHELLVDFENLNDENYRGISWGLDAPGLGSVDAVTVRPVRGSVDGSQTCRALVRLIWTG